jgi:hypothetical protein
MPSNSKLVSLLDSLSNPSTSTKDKSALLPNLLAELSGSSGTAEEASESLPALVEIIVANLDTNNGNIKSVILDIIHSLTTIYLPRHALDLNALLSPHFAVLANALISNCFNDSKAGVRQAAITAVLTLLPTTTLNAFYTTLVLNVLNASGNNWRLKCTALQLFATSLSTFPSNKSPVASKLGKSILTKTILLCTDANQDVRGEASDVVILLYSMDPNVVRSYVENCKDLRGVVRRELEEGFYELDGNDANANNADTNLANTHSSSVSDGMTTTAAVSTAKPPVSTVSHAHTSHTHTTHAHTTTTSGNPNPRNNIPTNPSLIPTTAVDWSEFEPLSLSSSSELTTCLNNVKIALENEDPDFWEERRDALGTLIRLLLGNSHVNFRQLYLGTIKSLNIGTQIEDLRSQVTNYACKFALSLARALGDTMSQFYELWLPSLLHLSISGVRLMALQGLACLKDIAAAAVSGYGTRVFQVLLAHAGGKSHPQQVRACATVMTVAYRKWDRQHLDKNNEKFVKLLKDLLSGKDPTVREEARHTYWAFHSQYEDLGNKLFSELDVSAQRLLTKSRADCDREWMKYEQADFVTPVFVKESSSSNVQITRTVQSANNATSSMKAAVAKNPLPSNSVQAPTPAATATGGPRRVVSKSNNTAASKAAAAAQHQVPQDVDEEPVFNLDSSLAELKGKHWAQREEIFQTILANIHPYPSQPLLTMSSGAATRLATALAGAIQEAHFKVSEVALRTTLACIENQTLAQHLASHLHLILPPILAQLVSQKGNQRTLANSCLNECRKTYDPNSLATVLCTKFSECNDRVKPGMLELLAVVVPTAGGYFSQVTNLRGMLSRLGQLLGARPPPTGALLSGIEHLANAFFHLSEDVFVAAVATLASDAQHAVKKMLVSSGICPEIDERVVFHQRGEKWSKNAPHSSHSHYSTHSHHNNHHNDLPLSPAVGSPLRSHVDPPPIHEAMLPKSDLPPSSWASPAPTHQGSSNQRTPGSEASNTDPVIRYMVRPPLSEEKMQRDWMREAPLILESLKMDSPSQDKYAGMQNMVQLARQNRPDVWTKYFGQILLILLEGIGQTVQHPNQMSPSNSSPISASENLSAIKHLFLQGVRALIKYQPSYFLEYIEIVVDRLLQCSRDPSYEIVHTAERALENLVTSIDATRCLKVITPYLGRGGDETIILSCVRTLQKFVGRIPSPALMSNLTLIMPSLVACFSSPSVDMRKAVVFAIVEVYFVLGDALMPHLSELNAAQLKLITIYIDRQNKNRGGASGVPGGGGGGRATAENVN